MRNWTFILYIIYFIIMYYLPINFLRSRMKEKKILRMIGEIVLLLLIYIIGENWIISEDDFVASNINELLKWILFIIVLLKPVNTKFKIFFDKYASENDKKVMVSGKNNLDGGGAMIGNLERLLIAILMLYGQYGAIGLVFTAKSVTRFDKISKDASFAEYYLIGSLYSMICVLVLYGLIIHNL